MACFFFSPLTSVRSRMISITSTRFHLMENRIMGAHNLAVVTHNLYPYREAI